MYKNIMVGAICLLTLQNFAAAMMGSEARIPEDIRKNVSRLHTGFMQQVKPDQRHSQKQVCDCPTEVLQAHINHKLGFISTSRVICYESRTKGTVHEFNRFGLGNITVDKPATKVMQDHLKVCLAPDPGSSGRAQSSNQSRMSGSAAQRNELRATVPADDNSASLYPFWSKNTLLKCALWGTAAYIVMRVVFGRGS